jgi:hypothetical protein
MLGRRESFRIGKTGNDKADARRPTMPAKILVVWRGSNRVDGIEPYLEKLVTPGMTAIFLIPYPLDSRQYLRDYWVTTESARAAVSAAEELSRRYSWETQKELAENSLAQVRRALQKMQVDLEIRLCSGSFREAMHDCIAGGDVLWVVSPARTASWSGLMGTRRGLFSGSLRSGPIILQDPQLEL